MSLSDLFKPWNWFWFACGPPLPNVALVLQYLQALRVSSDAIIKKKKKTKQKEKNIFCARVVRSQVVADFFLSAKNFTKFRDAEMFFPTRWAPVPRTVALSKKKKKKK